MAKTNEFSIKKELARQAKRHEDKRCIQCGGFDSRTYEGHVRCAACTYKNYIRAEALRSERAAAGMCTRCGKRPVLEGRKMCSECVNYISKHRGKK